MAAPLLGALSDRYGRRPLLLLGFCGLALNFFTTALASALFRDGGLSLVRSARMAQMPLAAFIAHVSRLGIPVVTHDASDVVRDMETLDQWLAAS